LSLEDGNGHSQPGGERREPRRMLSVIIPTHNSERTLVPTLSVLVPGATDGLVSEVLVADAGSDDETAAIADVAGCNFLVVAGPLGLRLKTAAAAARAPWLLFLRPGTVFDQSWTVDARRFVEDVAPGPRAAVFRRGAPAQPALREALSLLLAALGARPRPEQGLLIAKSHYDALGGHRENAADPEAELIRRIGGRRIAMLASSAWMRG
jgi:cellulose synthase/poly-beta-1,6-N-acetylglucosamine synthase-like glycosyltransferase